MEDASKSGESLASKLRSGLANAGHVAAVGIGAITTAAGAAVGGLLSLEQSTEEYRTAMGRLGTAFEASGYGADVAQEAYQGFYGILGDTDTATEASQLLAQLADSAEDVSVWTNIAAGVNGTFGDSLPIEGLIEAANETANVGTVTGVLADALNWVGISEDEFNEKLAECTDESDRNQLIMETLADTYDDAAVAFYKNNEALVESRNSQAQLDDTMADLGQTVSDIKNRFMSEMLPSISSITSAFSGMLQGTQGSEQAFTIAVQGMVNSIISNLPQFLNMGTQIITSLASGIIQSIPTLVSAIPQIVNEIGTALSQLFPQLLSTGTTVLEQIASGIETGLPDMVSRLPQIIDSIVNYLTESLPVILEKGTEILNSIINGIINAIPQLVAGLPQIITSITGFISDNLPDILQAGLDIMTNMITGIIDAIPDLVAALPQIITAIVDGIGGMMGSIVDIGKNIVSGIWDGIQSAADWLVGKVTGFFNDIVGGVKSFLGIASPSKVFAEIGGYMAEGVGKGWDSEFGQIKKDIEGGMDFGTAKIGFESSGLGVSSAGIINGVYGTAIGDSSYTFNLVLPDGTKLASYIFSPLTEYAKSNGTPILNPT